MPRFEILLDFNNKIPELKKEDITRVFTDWVDYMDPDAMTTLLGDAICNIEEEEYCEACQHSLKSPYEARRANDEDKEEGETLSNADEGSNSESDSSSDNNISDNGHGYDDSDSGSESNNSEDYDSQYNGNSWEEPSSDREYEDDGLYYEDYDDDVDYYDEDIEDDAKANRWSDTDSDQYRLENVLEAVGEEIGEANNVNYHGKEILELGSYYDSEPGSLTSYTKDEDDINARLAALDQKLMINSLRYITLESLEDDNTKMEGGESKHLLQHTHLSNKGKQDLFSEWINSIEPLDAFVDDKPTNMEIDDEATDFMDEDPVVLMLMEEETYWEPPVIVEAMTELKN
nr:uncharacterized protein LOC111987328 [Quercus suber]